MSGFVHVVVGIILNSRNQLLIAKRPEHLHQGGLWEFPGGKVEAAESGFIALIREFKEEVGIVIKQADCWMEVYHQYSDKNVFLDVWLSRHFDGDATGIEGQEVKWINLHELTKYTFPEANQKIVNKLLSEKL